MSFVPPYDQHRKERNLGTRQTKQTKFTVLARSLPCVYVCVCVCDAVSVDAQTDVGLLNDLNLAVAEAATRRSTNRECISLRGQFVSYHLFKTSLAERLPHGSVPFGMPYSSLERCPVLRHFHQHNPTVCPVPTATS